MDEAFLPAAFDIEGTLLRYLGVPRLALGQENPSAPKLMQPVVTAPAPSFEDVIPPQAESTAQKPDIEGFRKALLQSLHAPKPEHVNGKTVGKD
jgi:hypothetical protein